MIAANLSIIAPRWGAITREEGKVPFFFSIKIPIIPYLRGRG
jgi:hypothetical protein